MLNPLQLFNQSFFRLLFVAVLALVTWQALTPAPAATFSTINDKLGHFLAFFVLALLADWGWSGRTVFYRQALPLLAYGALIEIAQYSIPNRVFSVGDWIADGMGLLIYYLLLRAVLTPTSFFQFATDRNNQ